MKRCSETSSVCQFPLWMSIFHSVTKSIFNIKPFSPSSECIYSVISGATMPCQVTFEIEIFIMIVLTIVTWYQLINGIYFLVLSNYITFYFISPSSGFTSPSLCTRNFKTLNFKLKTIFLATLNIFEFWLSLSKKCLAPFSISIHMDTLTKQEMY